MLERSEINQRNVPSNGLRFVSSFSLQETLRHLNEKANIHKLPNDIPNSQGIWQIYISFVCFSRSRHFAFPSHTCQVPNSHFATVPQRRKQGLAQSYKIENLSPENDLKFSQDRPIKIQRSQTMKFQRSRSLP